MYHRYDYYLITPIPMDDDGPTGTPVVECIDTEDLHDREQGETLAAILRSLARMSHTDRRSV